MTGDAGEAINAAAARRDRRRWSVGAVLVGIGLGSLFDGIVFHQVLQWHHLISTPVPPDDLAGLELNTLADGIFHAAAWAVLGAGLVLIVGSAAAGTRSGAGLRFVAGLLAGWGGLNLLEGVIGHQLLALHHVRPGPQQSLYDYAYLAWGAAMLGAGWIIGRRQGARRVGPETGRRQPPER